MDTIARPPVAAPNARPATASDLTAAIRLVADGLARRVTISPVADARRLVEAAADDAEDHGVTLELLSDDAGSSGDPLGILVTRSREPG